MTGNLTAYLAESIKNLVEVDKDLSLGHLRNVVHTLTGIISDAGIRVAETGEDGRDNLFKISSNFLCSLSTGKGVVALWMQTHRTQSYGSGSEADEPTVPGVGLVNSVGIVVTELVDNLRYPAMVLGGQGIANQALELKGAALALVVELVVERLGDVDVHGDGGTADRPTLHGSARSRSHHGSGKSGRQSRAGQ